MDPLLIPGFLATLMGLICNYRQERAASETTSREDFFAYLDYHRHENLKDIILRTHNLSAEVDALLREDHAEIIIKLNTANSALATIISKIDGLSAISKTLAPASELSDQAYSILSCFYKSGSAYMQLVPLHGFSILMLEKGGNLEIEEENFLDDDLRVLLDLGFMTLTFTKKGTPSYRLTRSGAKYIAALENPK